MTFIKENRILQASSGKVSPHSFCLLTSVFCLLIIPSFANFDFNANCQSAMQAVLDLRTRDARLLIENEKKIHPENGYAIYLEHYTEAIELIISEDEKIYDELIDKYDERIDLLNSLDDGTPDSKWLQAEILFHTGLAQVKFGSRLSGATKILSSYRRIREHRQKYPHFWQNQKLTGMFNIIFDFIPPFMRWATDMFGLSGNSNLGIYQLENYTLQAGSTPGLAEEAVLITSLGYKLSWQEKKGLDFIAQQPGKILDNTLVTYLYASTARFAYRNELALDLLSKIRRNELQVEFYSLDYLTGRCKLNHLEDDANIYLQKYLDRYPGPDYKKDACNRLSLYYFIRGDKARYEQYRGMISSVGQTLRDPDQDAVIEAGSTTEPHPELLKARLLCDGGYFPDALKIMDEIEPDRLAETAYRIEYHYRMGRIMQLTGNLGPAISELNQAYDQGKNAPYTFATRSALQLGKIYEEKKDYPQALHWYKRCTETYSSAHTTVGVKDMAEKGLKRFK